MYVHAYASYISPKLEVQPLPGKGGYGVFAREPVAQGEVVIVWGGLIMSLEEMRRNVPPDHWRYSVQVEEDLYLVSDHTKPPEAADFINHACEPNVGIQGQIVLVAMRQIAPGEELCFDYAMTDGSPYDEFDCACGAASCRKHISGEDWKNPVLQARYAGYFSTYLQKRIEALQTPSAHA
ncbi:MAG: hypothetical protein Fur0018_07820 [Anaerolineales bacterium]